MTKTERLMAIDLIWSTLSESADDMPSPEWHGKILSRRLAKVDSGQGKFVSLEKLKKRLKVNET
jgi:hypothetical protein